MFDGQLTINQIWILANDRLGDLAPTQDQIIEMLGQLHWADLLQTALAIDTEELFERGQQQRRNKVKQGSTPSP